MLHPLLLEIMASLAATLEASLPLMMLARMVKAAIGLISGRSVLARISVSCAERSEARF